MLCCTGKCGEENQGTALHGSGLLLVEAVLAVGKAVWNTIVLLMFSGHPEPHNNPLFFFFFLSHATGEQSKVAPVTISSELCHQNFENVLFFLYVFKIFSSVVLLFWSKMVCVAVCRLELNAADWNLNCDLAVANCESAAELPIKPFSSSHSIFLYVSWFISLYHFCLVFCFFKSSDQPFVKLPYVLEIF